MIKETDGRIPALDGLRGIAALIVVLFHADALVGTIASVDRHYSQQSWTWQIYRRLLDGNFSVCVFFVLSGYVLLQGLGRRADRDYLSAAAVKRYFRLTPMVLAAVLLAYAISVSIGYWNSQAADAIGGHIWFANEFREQHDMHLGEAIRVGLFDVYAGSAAKYDGPLWSIKIELIGSFFLFAFAALFYRTKTFVPLVCATTAVLVFTAGESGLYCCLFLWGAVLLRFRPQRMSWLFLIAGAYLATINQWTREALWMQQGVTDGGINLPPVYVMAHSLGAVLLVAGLLGNQQAQRYFSARPVLWLGRVSFGLYVCHLPVLMSAGAWTLVHFAHHGHARAGAAFALAISLIVSLLVAELLTRWIDAPFQKVAGKIALWLLGDNQIDNKVIRYAHES